MYRKLEAPDTLTTWIGEAICLSPESGIGVATPQNVLVTKVTNPPSSAGMRLEAYNYRGIRVESTLPSGDLQFIWRKKNRFYRFGIKTLTEYTLHSTKCEKFLFLKRPPYFWLFKMCHIFLDKKNWLVIMCWHIFLEKIVSNHNKVWKIISKSNIKHVSLG